jgi:pyruvate kinase
MDRIIREVEHDDHYRVLTDAQHSDPQSTAADAIMHSLRAAAHIVSATATVIYTHSGSSSIRASRERPEAPILSLTPMISTARRLALVWGVHSVLTHEISDVDTMTELACQTALGEGFAKPGDSICIAAGVPFGRAGTTNMLRLATVWAPNKEKKGAGRASR